MNLSEVFVYLKISENLWDLKTQEKYFSDPQWDLVYQDSIFVH